MEVPTLRGLVRISIPPGTKSGERLRLKGEGVPSGTRGCTGDLYYIVGIEVPVLEKGKAEKLMQGWSELPPECHPSQKKLSEWIAENRRGQE